MKRQNAEQKAKHFLDTLIQEYINLSLVKYQVYKHNRQSKMKNAEKLVEEMNLYNKNKNNLISHSLMYGGVAKKRRFTSSIDHQESFREELQAAEIEPHIQNAMRLENEQNLMFEPIKKESFQLINSQVKAMTLKFEEDYKILEGKLQLLKQKKNHKKKMHIQI